MEGHRTAERRSIAYHRAIAERLMRDATLLDEARVRVSGWREPATHPRWVEAWSEVLDRPLDELCKALVDEGEHMTQLRQMTPFAGVLDARTRWSIWRAVH